MNIQPHSERAAAPDAGPSLDRNRSRETGGHCESEVSTLDERQAVQLSGIGDGVVQLTYEFR